MLYSCGCFKDKYTELWRELQGVLFLKAGPWAL